MPIIVPCIVLNKAEQNNIEKFEFKLMQINKIIVGNGENNQPHQKYALQGTHIIMKETQKLSLTYLGNTTKVILLVQSTV